MDALIGITGTLDAYLYTYVLVALLVGAGAYFTVRTRFVQLRLMRDALACLAEPRSSGRGGQRRGSSALQALLLSTASRVGTGNIVGVSTAIALGGPGAVVWMWAMCLVGAASAFVESTLAQIWKVRDGDGGFRGGPAYYIEQALGKRWLGNVFAVLLILSYALGFNGLQAYTMSSSLAYYFDATNYAAGNRAYFSSVVPLVLGIAFALFLLFVVRGGSRRIQLLSAVVVPVMAVTYIAFAAFVAVTHVADMPRAMGLMFSELLRLGPVEDGVGGLRALAGGIAGSAIMLGVKRGLYSNEAGMGSAPNAAAMADVSHPVKSGLVQVLSVYIDTLVICTCSAIIVLSYYVEAGGTGGFDGIFLAQKAVEACVGPVGVHVLTFAMFAFGLSSIGANYYYAENNLAFVTSSKTVLHLFQTVYLVPVFTGAQIDIALAWNLADLFMGCQTLVNIAAVLLLGRWAFAALRDYEAQRARGSDPVFSAASVPGMPATRCW